MHGDGGNRDEGNAGAAAPHAVADENRRMRRLRMMVDFAVAVLRHRPLTRGEAEQLVDHVRANALELFPGKGETFDLIYRPRFRRIIEERFGG